MPFRCNTFEVKRNVRVAFPERVESVTAIDSSVVGGRLRDLECEQVGIDRDGFAQYLEPLAIDDLVLAMVPGNVGHWHRLQNALHRKHIALLGDGGFLGESGWLAIRTSARWKRGKISDQLQ